MKSFNVLFLLKGYLRRFIPSTILVSLVMLLNQPAQAVSSPDSFYLFGVVNDQGLHYNDLWQRGVRAVTFELKWELYEPLEGIYDQAYIDHMKGLLHDLKQQGWFVQLIPGFHYAPDWVFSSYPDVYYVNQYGERYDPDPITKGDFRIINAPFNPKSRSLIAGYLARVFQDFDQSDPYLRFDSVRIGGGPQGELRYPPPDWNGKHNSYWAFDIYAQNPSISTLPAQLIGWRPGIDSNPGSINRGQLLVNPGFEETHEHFSFPGWAPDEEVVATASSDPIQSGNQSLRLEIKSSHRIHQFVRVEPNQVYEFGGWAISSDGSGLARILVTQYDGNNKLLASAPFGKVESASIYWTELTSTITTLPETTFLKFEMDGNQPGSYYFDDLWLKKTNETNTMDRDIDIPLAFYDWYVNRMTNYQTWQISEIRKHFDGRVDLVYAGKGVRMNQINDALTNDLHGDGWSEFSRGLYSASDYLRHVIGIADNNATLYMTGIEDPVEAEVDDKSPYPGEWSGAHWLAYLAHNQGFAIWGENSGMNTLQEMMLSVKRMQGNGFIGLMWAHESHLYANPNPENYASASDYQAVIEFYAQQKRIYIPLISINP